MKKKYHTNCCSPDQKHGDIVDNDLMVNFGHANITKGFFINPFPVLCIVLSLLRNPYSFCIQCSNIIWASWITSNLTTSTACSGLHLSSTWFALYRLFIRWLVISPHRGPVIWKSSPCCDIIMKKSFHYIEFVVILLWCYHASHYQSGAQSS